MKLADTDISQLLPQHITDDPQFSASINAINPHLQMLAKSIPNLLIFARLGQADPSRFLPPLKRLTAARDGLSILPMEILELLAWQFHVDFREAAKNSEQLAGMILNSIAWHRIKGTPASIKAALNLFGFTGIEIEEHDSAMNWATYQLNFSGVSDFSDIKAIVDICHEMQPARCKLWRIYNKEFDMRSGYWSGPLPRNSWSNSWWSFYSGAETGSIPGLNGKGLIVSLGLRKHFQIEKYVSSNFASIWQNEIRTFRIPRLNNPVWSYSHWSDKHPGHHCFVSDELLSVYAGDVKGIFKSERWEAKPFWSYSHWSDKYLEHHWPDKIWGELLGLTQNRQDIGCRIRGDNCWQDIPWANDTWDKARYYGA